jgi:acyl CoA:acetate/3-ketoacid CoA transferase beta subunit
MGMAVDVRNRIAKRAAKEIDDGLIVNLGIGIPTGGRSYSEDICAGKWGPHGSKS